ncbi:hypothetical protein WMY93_016084 [Mugilogobius chulae]|uniref:Uncharacterized protein n=1 Tax=Mugilogobius chulae TaxID=88201 RepID=A0AAW0NT40_9GOBI
MERTSSVRKKTMARQHKAEVMIAGEQLRLKLHDGKLIKERRYHLRTYPNCLVGQELIDWLVSHKEAPDRTTAVFLMQHLMDHDIVHQDDGTFPFNTEVKTFMRGQQLYEQLIGDKNSILQLREEHGVAYQRSFPGCQLIDWIIQNGEAESRSRGLELCRALQEHGIIQHVGLHNEIKSAASGRRGSLNSHKIRSDLPSFTPLSTVSTVQCNPKSVLTRKFTCEELLAPGAPFIKKVLTVIGDALGWGFVVRGTAPCYVQAVDPGSPAAAAGIKVRQFVCQVNGQFVLNMDYKSVTRLVMTGTRTVVLSIRTGLGSTPHLPARIPSLLVVLSKEIRGNDLLQHKKLCLELCKEAVEIYRSKPFCCTECSFSSKYYSGYKNHFRNVHRKIFDRILLNCPYCTFTASRKTMEIHIRIFHQSRLPQPNSANAVVTHPYASSQQAGMRPKDSSFVGRARQDSLEKPVYYCKKCTFRDSLYNVVRRHIYREHFQHVVSPYLAMAPNPSVKNGVSNTILCKRCQFSTRSYEALVQHVVEYHERIGAQVTAMVGHANMMVSKPQASPLTSQRVPVITNRALTLSSDPGVQPVIGYLKPNVSKTYSPSAPIKARNLQGKSSLAENNVPLVNTAQTQKWKICTVCNELFPENLYSAHFESAHKAKKVWALAKYIMKIHNFTSKCLLCNRYLPSDTLLNHVLIHGLTCPQCHSAFHSVEKLIEHGPWLIQLLLMVLLEPHL